MYILYTSTYSLCIFTANIWESIHEKLCKNKVVIVLKTDPLDPSTPDRQATLVPLLRWQASPRKAQTLALLPQRSGHISCASPRGLRRSVEVTGCPNISSTLKVIFVGEVCGKHPHQKKTGCGAKYCWWMLKSEKLLYNDGCGWKNLKWKYAMIRWMKGTLQRKERGRWVRGVKASLFLHIKSVYITYILQIHYRLYHYHILCELKSNKMSKMLSEPNSGGAARSWVLVSAIEVPAASFAWKNIWKLEATQCEWVPTGMKKWHFYLSPKNVTLWCGFWSHSALTLWGSLRRFKKTLICDGSPKRQGLLGSQLGLQGVLHNRKATIWSLCISYQNSWFSS